MAVLPALAALVAELFVGLEKIRCLNLDTFAASDESAAPVAERVVVQEKNRC